MLLDGLRHVGQSRGYVWDSTTLSWVAETQAGGGVGSTTVNISSVSGAVVVRSSAADAIVTAKNSTIGDFLASVQQNSTTWQTQAAVRTSSGAGVEGSTAAPASGVLGLHMRPVLGTLDSTTVVITSTHSTAVYSLVSSVANVRHKCFAYFVGSTHTVPSTLVFMSSATIDRWHVNFGSGSSGMTGANCAVSAPSWLFHTNLHNALNCRIEGGSSVTSTVVARLSIGWYDEA